MGAYGSQDHVQVAENLVVPEPEHRPTVVEEPAISRDIGWMFEMLAAVTLDNDSVPDTHEVGDVAADDYLTPILALELSASKG